MQQMRGRVLCDPRALTLKLHSQEPQVKHVCHRNVVPRSLAGNVLLRLSEAGETAPAGERKTQI